MNLNHFHTLMEKCNFPADARDVLSSYTQRIHNGHVSDFDKLVSLYFEKAFVADEIQPDIDAFSKLIDMSPYSLWLIVLIEAADRAKPIYEQHNISEAVYWDTFSDLCYKAKECKDVHGVWGTFVASWYKRFFTCDLVKLGRLEYENAEYSHDEPYTVGNITVDIGYPIKKIHIPSGGGPFDRTARFDSYRKAYEFFSAELNGKPIVFTCSSWLLYPDHKDAFTPGSNTADFIDDFDIIYKKDSREFSDAWRVFGGEYIKTPSELPEKTSMQRAFKKRLVNGDSFGSGLGIFLFDGEKIIKN